MAKRGGRRSAVAYEANPIVTKLDPETIVYLNDLYRERRGRHDPESQTPTNHNLPRRKTTHGERQHTPPAQTQPAPPPSAPPADNNYFHRSSPLRRLTATADTVWRQPSPLWTPAGGRTATVARFTAMSAGTAFTYSWGYSLHYAAGTLEHPRLVLGTRLPLSPAWAHWRSSDTAAGPLPRVAIVTGVGYMWHGSRVMSGSLPSHHHYTYCDYAYSAIGACTTRDTIPIVHNETKVVNNHITENNTTIINNGVPPELVEKKTREPVRKVVSARWILS